MKKAVCFHDPDEIHGYLSNWYLSDFCVGSVQYSSMEQYMMHQKALLFGDAKTAEQILSTTNAGKIKALGRSVKNYEDRIWGIGLSMKDERRFRPDEWQGQNLLGFALMRVREALKHESGPGAV